MIHIHGVTVTVRRQTKQSGEYHDPFNRPILRPVETFTVDNVLIGEPSSDDIMSSTNLGSGHRIRYRLAIPKGDDHDWSNCIVTLPEPWGGESIRYRTVGDATLGIEANIPLVWNKKVLLEAYD